jgi:PKD repeat protein
VNLPPVARLQLPLQALVGESITADGSGSTDSDGHIVNYVFSFGDSTPDESGTAPSVNHSWAAEGTYTVTLTVTDDQGATDGASAQIHVAAAVRVPGPVDDGPDTLGATCSLGIDPSGAVVIAYRDVTHPGLRVATVTSSGAVIEHVDGMGYEVDGAIARYDDPSSYVAIALDPSRGERPAIAYFNYASTPQTVIATRAAGAWTDRALLSGSTYMGGLAISAAGNALVNVYQGGYSIGTWDGASASMTVSSALPGVSGFYQQPVLLGLDPSANAVSAFATSVARVKAAPTVSPYEESATTSAGIFVDAQGAAWLAFAHSGELEIATALDGGYWRRTSLGPMDAGHPAIAVDGAGNARVCFFRSGKLMLY